MIYQSVILTTIVLIYTSINRASSVDLQSILSAEISCCPSHAGSEADCLAESYSNCVWLPADDPIVLNTPSGSQCLGVSYVECKKPDPTGCCGPCCGCPPETPAPLGPGETPAPLTSSVPPVCGPLVTTSSTTIPPYSYECQLGVNYLFEGQSCMISGDPHTIMWNGDAHDLQGIPWVDFGSRRQTLLKNQFFYIAPCDGAYLPYIPIKVLGTHYKWGDRTVSGIDYMVIILTDDNGDEYYLFFSSAIHQYGIGGVGGISTNYDDNVANGKTMLTFADRQTYSIGNRFKVFYNEAPDQRIKVTVTVDDTDTFRMFMAVQTSFVYGRYRMHYVQMDLPSSMKCYACGLCGDFKRPMTGEEVEEFEGCDGTVYDFRAGLSPEDTPESYDQDGWSWEYNYVMDTCTAYDITDNIPDGIELKDVCFAGVADDVAAECLKQKQENADCCRDIGGTFCADLLRNCKVDACAGVGTNTDLIEAEVTKVMTDIINTVCEDDELNGGFGHTPLSILQCPAGSVQATGVGGLGNDILGCGLTICKARFKIDNIEDCMSQCQGNAKCVAYTWAPIGGDENNLDENVCTMYDSDEPNHTHGPNQIFCKLADTTCSLEAFVIGKDEVTVSLSQNGGITFDEIQESLSWTHLIDTVICGITPDTILKYKVVNTGTPTGGFGATVNVYLDQDTTTSATIVTNSPLTTFDIVSSTSDNDGYTPFGMNRMWNQYWNSETYPQIDTSTYINRIDSGTYTEYTLDFNDHKRKLEMLGCWDRNAMNKERLNNVIHDDKVIEGEMKDESNHIGLIIGVGLVFLACFAGLFYRNRNIEKYQPLLANNNETRYSSLNSSV